MNAKLRQNAFGVLGRPATNVGHPNPKAIHLEPHMFWPGSTCSLVVYVAVHRPAGGHLGQGVGHGEVSDVACVPHFIARRRMLQDVVVDVTMGVGEQKDVHSCWRAIGSPPSQSRPK